MDLFSIQATTFMMLETKTSSIRSDRSVLDLLQYIKECNASVGRVSQVVLGQAESPTKQTTGKGRSRNLLMTAQSQAPRKHVLRNTLNEEESQWVKRLEKATFTGPYAYAKPPSDKWDSETCGGVTEKAWYEQMIQHIKKQ